MVATRRQICYQKNQHLIEVELIIEFENISFKTYFGFLASSSLALCPRTGRLSLLMWGRPHVICHFSQLRLCCWHRGRSPSSLQGKPCSPSSETRSDTAPLINWHWERGTHLASPSRIKPRLLVKCQPGESDFLGDTLSFSLRSPQMSQLTGTATRDTRQSATSLIFANNCTYIPWESSDGETLSQ